MWTKGTCEKTMKTRSMLEKHNISYSEIDTNDDASISLVMHTGYCNFPNIYYGEQHVGGLDDIKTMLEQPRIKENKFL